MPRATQRPAVLADPSDFLDLARSPNGPRVLNDYLYSDEPQLALHIVSFQDATLISISLPHTLTDGTGGGRIYLSWSLALQGRDDEIPAFHGFDHDPLATFGETSSESYMYADRLVTGWRAILFKLGQWYDSVRYRSESRVVCMPAAVLADLRQTAIEEIRAATKDDEAFVSDNDVLCAWFTRLAISDTPQTSDRTIRIMNAFSLAAVLGNDRIPSAKAYVSNAATEMYAFLSAREIFTKPLSYTAYAVRRSMMNGGTRNQVEALAALKRQYMAENGEPPILGDATMEMISFSNWSKGKFLETDFSAAIIKEGSPRAARANRPGIPSYIQFNAWSKKFQIRNIFPIMGKDAAGNYWLQGPLREGVWDMIDRKLKAAD
ncbi:transcriptional regulator sdnM [Colletotrichum liriopes]|uniref:Transcriptional regulator sdnM n=1 Tax=Colletotrichum liriopes TaxID=708192 RepID=A0AA37GS52_9PEZI|nr:transcriptional regulator sdnM [Colletotrichum liriopes]